MRSIELFSGAGGLSIGIAKAGFHHEIICDADHSACQTIRLNQRAGNPMVQDWKIIENDANLIDFSGIQANPELLAGGPPCQPFSRGGLQKGALDPRDCWPATVRATKALAPKAFIWENVPNLASAFPEYTRYIILTLSFPEIGKKPAETIQDHAERLEREPAPEHTDGLAYRVGILTLNAETFGTAQKRRRIFIVGLRSDLTGDIQEPAPSHSTDELFRDQWVTGLYWRRHGIAMPEPPEKLRPKIDAARRLSNTQDLFGAPTIQLSPARTVRDAIGDMPEPGLRAPDGLPNHIRPDRAAKPYGTKHTGSPLDLPAKTTRAGDHGVSGGENMIDYGNGTYRHYTVREAARLSDFPDDWLLAGNWSDGLRMAGNAVPCAMSRAVGHQVALALAA